MMGKQCVQCTRMRQRGTSADLAKTGSLLQARSQRHNLKTPNPDIWQNSFINLKLQSCTYDFPISLLIGGRSYNKCRRHIQQFPSSPLGSLTTLPPLFTCPIWPFAIFSCFLEQNPYYEGHVHTSLLKFRNSQRRFQLVALLLQAAAAEERNSFHKLGRGQQPLTKVRVILRYRLSLVTLYTPSYCGLFSFNNDESWYLIVLLSRYFSI
jgi:hypothetical protein